MRVAITFGVDYGQPGSHPAHSEITCKRYVIFEGENFEDCRAQAFATLGRSWAMSYSVHDPRFIQARARYGWTELMLESA